MGHIWKKGSLGNKERKTTNKFLFVLFFLLLLSVAIAFIGITSAKTIHVPDDYPTIQQAVDDATDGDTIIVHSGTYYENVMIGQSLTIIGEGAIIDAGGEFQCLDMQSTSGSIRGFTVQNGDIGIGLSHASNVNVEGNTALNNLVGFHLWDSNNNNVKNNIAQRNEYSGMAIHGWDGAEGSSYNTITNNELSNNGAGIEIYTSSNYNEITNNIIMGNKYEGIHIHDSCNSSTITDNEILNNDVGIYIEGDSTGATEEEWIAGIYLNNANYCNISENNFSNNQCGILLDYSSNNTIAKNRVSNKNTEDYGILLDDSSNNTITNNHVSNNWCGISLDCSSNNIITNNHILDTDEGIVLEDSSNNIITNNSVANSWSAGISLWDSSNNDIENNRFENDGISIWGNELSDFNTHIIKNNTINEKPIYYYKNTNGIKVPEDAGEVILANCDEMIIENINASFGTVGIELAYTTNSEISRNSVSKNVEGVLLIYSSNNFVTNNNVSNNGDGIWLDSSPNNIITSNNVSNSWWEGIWLDCSSNNNLTSNSISNTNTGEDGILLEDSSNLNSVKS